ncbi:hypothetical protein C8R44DRAFT_757924 [Mycena epipterygia]|nr:hypothetical protein C8R44DRAFT_757924 [Mycena epipterygia]
MATVDIPVELQDLIIDHVHEQKQTLSTCGLVCKTWLRSSRHHLFGSVTLCDYNWEEFLLLESPLATFATSIESFNHCVFDKISQVGIFTGLPVLSGNLNLPISKD